MTLVKSKGLKSNGNQKNQDLLPKRRFYHLMSSNDYTSVDSGVLENLCGVHSIVPINDENRNGLFKIS